MAAYLDSVPFSGIIRIRDMMYSVTDPFRLDQGDVSFNAPDSVKTAMVRAITENKTHYLQTTGVPRLRELIAAKLRDKNRIPVDDPEHVLVTNGEHVSIASLQGMYERTIPLYTFSKSYAMTGLRLGYIAIKDPAIRDRAKKVLFYTASNIASIVQFGGIGALEGPQDSIDAFRTELRARRDLFYRGIREFAG